ncbi:excinuclease ABC subunit UvrC [Flavobacteriaceae bacterium]|nr:excinuclease ABC subunit UvrC [Flavobacteriaceae bacterium]
MEKYPIYFQFKTLPTDPGVYQFFGKEDKVIYIGKAKNLKKRVGSYFNKVHDNNKTSILVKKIHRMEHIVVPSEVDALLLENSLIKKYRPKYNILLKDDKTYPWICLKKDPFPRILSTRKVIRDGSEYYGPYPNVKTLYTLIELIKDVYPFLNHELNHLIKVNDEECIRKLFEENKGAIRQLINGNFKASIKKLKAQMEKHSKTLEFEKANKIKDKLESLENYQAKSTVVNSKITNVDVFSIFSDESYGYVNFFQVAFGAIIRSHTIEIKKKLEESDKELLSIAIVSLRQRFDSQSKEVYLPFKVELGENIKVTIPILGDKRKLVELSKRNAKFFRLERFKHMKIVDPDRHVRRLMNQMKVDLRLNEEPIHIECFDNSNIQGTNPTAACVVFRKGKPFKKDYRHFKIKTVEGPDDFASMEEVVHRRYKRLRDEGVSLPQLIVIDGGKGQLSSAVKSIDRLGLRGKIAIIGIAKRLEEIYYPGDSIPMYLDKKSETLKIIQQLRNEAHRFGLNLHRKIRSKDALKSPLDNIEGLGNKTKERLIKEFKSLKRIKAAPEGEIIKLLGEVKGVNIFKKLNEL